MLTVTKFVLVSALVGVVFCSTASNNGQYRTQHIQDQETSEGIHSHQVAYGGGSGYGHGHGYTEHKVYPPQPYKFGYEIKDPKHGRNFRHEHSDGSGNTKGTYGYQDAWGLYRVVDYIADKHGFRAAIRTNEPGTASSHPASVNIQSVNKPSLHPIGLGSKQQQVVVEPNAPSGVYAHPQPQYHQHNYQHQIGQPSKQHVVVEPTPNPQREMYSHSHTHHQHHQLGLPSKQHTVVEPTQNLQREVIYSHSKMHHHHHHLGLPSKQHSIVEPTPSSPRETYSHSHQKHHHVSLPSKHHVELEPTPRIPSIPRDIYSQPQPLSHQHHFGLPSKQHEIVETRIPAATHSHIHQPIQHSHQPQYTIFQPRFPHQAATSNSAVYLAPLPEGQLPQFRAQQNQQREQFIVVPKPASVVPGSYAPKEYHRPLPYNDDEQLQNQSPQTSTPISGTTAETMVRRRPLPPPPQPQRRSVEITIEPRKLIGNLISKIVSRSSIKPTVQISME